MTEETTQTTLRDALTASFDSVEASGSQPAEQTAQVSEPSQETQEQTAQRVRDDQGKFAKTPEVEPAPVEQPQAPQRPTTWKKEYLPIWDKLATGQPLTAEESNKLAAYSNQRENEYKSGVSTYKAEAEQAKQLQEAIAPFMPDLQQHNIPVNQWITNLGNAHRTLAIGTPEQKLQMFSKLAQDYGIPLNMVAQTAQGGQPDHTAMQLMQELATLKQQVSGVTGWREQQEQQQITQQISQFEDTSKYPHFELVRGNMAQLLESGKAQDLQTAYEMAAEPIESMIAERLSQVQQPQAAKQVIQKAKATAGIKSVTPSGSVTTSTAKDRRSMLSEQVDALMGGARV